MNDSRRDFLEIVTQIRSHLEYQRALGVSGVPILPAVDAGAATPAKSDSRPSAPTAVKGKATQPPPLNMPVAGGSGTQASALAAVREELGECVRCRLSTGRKTIVFGEGDPTAALVFVGEGPGKEEDEQGRPFVGAAGQLLTDIIVKGMQLRREDVYICNIVKCRPPDNRNPETDEIDACAPFLRKQVQAIHPRVIIALGNIAVKTLLKTDKGITALRGKWQTFEGIPLMPTFHPAYLLRNPRDKKLVWEDIQKVMAKLGIAAKE